MTKRRRGINKRQAKRRRRITKLVFFSLIIFVIYSLVYKTNIFNIKKINVTGNKKVVTEEIIKKSTFKENFKIFNFDKKVGIENIEKIPYIKSAEIKRRIPNIVNITVKERVPIAMVSNLDKVIFIDKEGYALEIKDRVEDLEFPDISGIKVNKTKPGQRVFPDKNLNDQVEFLELSIKNNVLNRMKYINFSNMNEIILELITGEKVYLGNLNDMEEKLIILNEIVIKLEEDNIKATKIELRDSSKAIVSTGEDILYEELNEEINEEFNKDSQDEEENQE